MLSGRHLVVIEDDALMGNSLVQRLELEGADVTWVRREVQGIAAVRSPHRPVDAVICDIRLPDGSGEAIFAAVSRTITPPPFLFITGQGEIDQAVRLLRSGAADYLTKPFEMPDFLKRLGLILRPLTSGDMPVQTGVSAQARQVDTQAANAATHDRPVLIRGQRGLGKARIARTIHERSDRRAAPFAMVDAFRPLDAKEFKATLSEASDGTLLVAGIALLDREHQDRLSAALHEGTFRLIATSGPGFDTPEAEGRLQPDLFYALLQTEIVVPPLGVRPDDAVWLAGQLFHSLNQRRARPLKGLSELALEAIRSHDWPGNGRELRARLSGALDAAAGDWIFPGDICPELTQGETALAPLFEAREQAERLQIIRALEHTGGQVTEAARLLKVSRTTLWEKMQKLRL